MRIQLRMDNVPMRIQLRMDNVPMRVQLRMDNVPMRIQLRMDNVPMRIQLRMDKHIRFTENFNVLDFYKVLRQYEKVPTFENFIL